MRNLVVFLLIIGLAVGVSLGLCRWKVPDPKSVATDDGSPIALGKPAPDFTGTDLNGQKVKLSDFKGKPVLIDFWATWCGPCVESLPHTQKLYADSAKEGFAVLTVAEDKKDSVADFVKQNNYTFPVCLDEDQSIGSQFVSEGIPTVVVIDAKGNLAAYIVGSGRDEEIEAALRIAGAKVAMNEKGSVVLYTDIPPIQGHPAKSYYDPLTAGSNR